MAPERAYRPMPYTARVTRDLAIFILACALAAGAAMVGIGALVYAATR
jgi:hypothetical protein